MADVILGIFAHPSDASDAVEELKEAGYTAKDISIIMREDTPEAQQLQEATGSKVANSAGTGVLTGSMVGGLAGLLIGVGALALPGIGPLLVGGPIATALGLTGAAATTVTGAATGAVAGGLVGALVGLGLPENEARVYEQRIMEGGILVTVPVQTGNETEAEMILEDNGAEQIRLVQFDAPMRQVAAS